MQFSIIGFYAPLLFLIFNGRLLKFRVGDSVHIRKLDTWGDVLAIGTCTTRVRTKDNRELIVPNSQVAKSQIVNYNYPDTKYRQQTNISMAYGIDIGRIRKKEPGRHG